MVIYNTSLTGVNYAEMLVLPGHDYSCWKLQGWGGAGEGEKKKKKGTAKYDAKILDDLKM